MAFSHVSDRVYVIEVGTEALDAKVDRDSARTNEGWFCGMRFPMGSVSFLNATVPDGQIIGGLPKTKKLPTSSRVQIACL